MSMVISSWNVQNPLLFGCSCFIRSHLREYSYHPVSLSLLCPLSLILLLSLPPSFFFLYHSFFIAHSLPSILLLARPSAPLLCDVSVIPPRLSTVVISSIFQCYPHSLPPHLSHFPCPPFLSSLSILLSLCYALSTPLSFSLFLFPLLFLEYVIFHTSWHHQSSISHWPCIHPDINQLVLVS